MMKFKVKMIDTFNIVPNCNRVRVDNNNLTLDSMVESIRRFGIIQPLIVKKRLNSKSILVNGEYITSPSYELICGELRWRSARILNLKRIPCIVLKNDNAGNDIISLIENLQRKDYSILEQATIYDCLLKKYCVGIDDLSDMIGVPKGSIMSKLNILKLSKEEQTIVINYNLSEDHIREIIRIDDNIVRKRILMEIIVSGLNIFETEDLIDEYFESLSPQNDSTVIENNKKIYKINDIRFFYNSLEKCLSILKQTGITFDENKIEEDDYIDIHIRINKHKAS